MMWHKLREIITYLPTTITLALNVSKQWPSCRISVIANVSVMEVVLRSLSEQVQAREGESVLV